MGNVRARKETGKLTLDFRYQNQRCREQTALADTPANRKRLATLLERVEAEIVLGQFDYAKYFPNSSMAKKLAVQGARLAQHRQKTPRFNDFTEVWFGEMQSGWRISYRTTLRGILNRRLLPAFGKQPVDEITKADLLQFRAKLSKEVRSSNQKSLSPDHINRNMKILRMILNEAADRFEFTSPYHGIKPLKVPKGDIDPFSLDEICLILDNVRDDFRDYYAVRFYTGMRTGEIDGLKWKYVDLERRQLLIRETIVAGREEYTKNDSSQREIHLSQPVYEALQRQFKLTGKRKHVFCNRNGSPLDHNNVTKRIWYPLLKRLSLARRRPYQTRHTAATLWLAAGESPEWIAFQLGHTSCELLFRTYSRFVPNLTRQDGSAMERLLAERMNSKTENRHE